MPELSRKFHAVQVDGRDASRSGGQWLWISVLKSRAAAASNRGAWTCRWSVSPSREKSRSFGHTSYCKAEAILAPRVNGTFSRKNLLPAHGTCFVKFLPPLRVHEFAVSSTNVSAATAARSRTSSPPPSNCGGAATRLGLFTRDNPPDATKPPGKTSSSCRIFLRDEDTGGR